MHASTHITRVMLTIAIGVATSGRADAAPLVPTASPSAAPPASPAGSPATAPLPARAASRARLVIAGDLDRLSQAAAVERAIRDAAPNTTVEIVLAPANVRIDVAWAMMKALRAAEGPTRVHLALDRLARDQADRAARPTIHPLALAIALRANDCAIDPNARIMGAACDDTSDVLIDEDLAGAAAPLIRAEVAEWFENALREAPEGLFDLLWLPRDVSSLARPLAAEPPDDPVGVLLWRQARLMQQYKDIRTGARISADPAQTIPLRSAIIDARTLAAMGVIASAPLGPERDLSSHTLVPATEALATQARNDLAAAQAAVRKAQRALDLEEPSTRAVAESTYRRAIDAARNAARDAANRVQAAAAIIDAEPDVAALAPPGDMALATPAQRRARWKRELQSVLDDCARVEEKARSFEETFDAR